MSKAIKVVLSDSTKQRFSIIEWVRNGNITNSSQSVFLTGSRGVVDAFCPSLKVAGVLRDEARGRSRKGIAVGFAGFCERAAGCDTTVDAISSKCFDAGRRSIGAGVSTTLNAAFELNSDCAAGVKRSVGVKSLLIVVDWVGRELEVLDPG